MKIVNRMAVHLQRMSGKIYACIEDGFSWWNVDCIGAPIIDRHPESKIIAGSNVLLISSARFTALGTSVPVILRTLRPGAVIEIGNNTGISGSVIVASKYVKIGQDVLIGSGCKIFDTDFHPIEPVNRRRTGDASLIPSKEIIIEDNVFIGTSCIICKGVTIGENSVIAAGSVVAKSVPRNCIYGGNPAKKIRDL